MDLTVLMLVFALSASGEPMSTAIGYPDMRTCERSKRRVLNEVRDTMPVVAAAVSCTRLVEFKRKLEKM